jgi:hypothetical protein
VPVICATGYESDGYGKCVEISQKFVPPVVCPSGQYSNGDGDCFPKSVTVSCVSGW